MVIPHSRQSGATLLILVLVMLSVFATLLVSSLRGRNPEETRRDQSAAAIEQARQALIAWSLSRDGTSGAARLNPVELPCPANPNEASPNSIGTSRLGNCTGTAARIGWLPWKTMGIPKIVDAYGEPLWYAVDLGFLVRDSSNPARKVNSDSLSIFQVFAADGITSLSLNGETPAAIIFAAGPPISGQTRASPYAAAQYLEGVNGQNNAALGGPYIAGDLSNVFNDQLGVITGRELIDRVAPRLGAELSQQLKVYYQAFATNYPGLVQAPSSPFAKQNVLVYLQQLFGVTARNASAAGYDFGDTSICRRVWSPTSEYYSPMMVSERTGNSSNFKNYTATGYSLNKDPSKGNNPWNSLGKCDTACAAAWTSSGRNSGGTAYFQNDVVSQNGKNWQAIYQIGIGSTVPPTGEWADAGSCTGTPPTPTPAVTPTPSTTPSVTPTASPATPTPSATPTVTPTPVPAPYPYPADITDGDGNGVADTYCRDNQPDTGINPCASKANLCAGILPRAANSWKGVGLLPSPASNNLPEWFKQNVWHRGVLYAVKQGSSCTASFNLDGTVDASIDALFILPGAVIRPTPSPFTRANNLLSDAQASTDLTLYLEDIANQNKWLIPNDRNYVTPSCTSNDVMYTCNKGVCSKRKRAC
ncbi:pilus assembly FimT family protein [Deefgea rivuli]|uniref:pilus assembly FimT family protein n=1 Tax=Deefgea rivuli TaxID=400948 RepID=UPI000482F78A|nr:type II secretion system protein [Deefgea rivuli]